MKILRQTFLALVYILPAVLFFSYYPLISLGRDATMNFELSLPLIWLALFGVIAIILALAGDSDNKLPRPFRSQRARKRRASPVTTGRSDAVSRNLLLRQDPPKVLAFALFPLYATLSIFWSANQLRAFLTAGVIWLIFIAIFAFIYILPTLAPKNFRQNFFAVFFYSAAAICVVCWLQSILDVAGLARAQTLLCAGCTSQTFGFPHPSGFAIEPQFMGNLLLAPTLLALYFLVFKQEKRCLPFALCFSATLFLTMSRGAIYAYACGLAVSLFFAIKQRQNFRPLIIVPLATFFVTLAAQGIFATLSPTPDNFISGTTKVIHQLSLGKIDLRPASVTNPAKSEAAPSLDDIINTSSASENPESSTAARFDGYVAASTNIRLGLNGIALKTWAQNPATMLFGVGLGGAGVAMSRAEPNNPLIAPDAIVQNEPLSLLLELGAVGIAIIVGIIWRFLSIVFRGHPEATAEDERASPVTDLVGIRKKNELVRSSEVTPQNLSEAKTGRGDACRAKATQEIAPLAALLVAYAVTLQFFSGPANALQIYLLPPLLFVVLLPKDLKSPAKSPKSSPKPAAKR